MPRIWQLLLVLPLMTSVASADRTYAFKAAQDIYLAVPNSRVDVDLFLIETITGPDTSLILSENGLFSAGLRVDLTGMIPSDPARVVSGSDIVGNPQFQDSLGPIVTTSPTSTTILEAAFENVAAGALGSDLGGGVRLIPLATFTYTTGANLLETSTFSLTDFAPNPSDDTLTFASQVVLDDQIQTGVFNIRTVPA